MDNLSDSSNIPFIIKLAWCSVAFSSKGLEMMQSYLWEPNHENKSPYICTYLTLNLSFVPPRQQIAALVIVSPSESDRHSCLSARGIRATGCLSIKLFNAKVNSHAPPPLQQHTSSHTLPHFHLDRQEDCVSAAFHSLPAPVCTLVFVCLFNEERGTHAKNMIVGGGSWDCMCVCLCVALEA